MMGPVSPYGPVGGGYQGARMQARSSQDAVDAPMVVPCQKALPGGLAPCILSIGLHGVAWASNGICVAVVPLNGLEHWAAKGDSLELLPMTQPAETHRFILVSTDAASAAVDSIWRAVNMTLNAPVVAASAVAAQPAPVLGHPLPGAGVAMMNAFSTQVQAQHAYGMNGRASPGGVAPMQMSTSAPNVMMHSSPPHDHTLPSLSPRATSPMHNQATPFATAHNNGGESPTPNNGGALYNGTGGKADDALMREQEEKELAARFAVALRSGDPTALSNQLAHTFMEVRAARASMASVVADRDAARAEADTLRIEVAALKKEVEQLRQRAGVPSPQVSPAKPTQPALDTHSRQRSSKELRRAKTVLGMHTEARAVTDDYELGEVLGEGSFGVARRARHRETGGVFACKSISKQKLHTAQAIEDVRREVEIMHHLAGHPNIVRLEGTYEDSKDVHLILELCTGGDLFERLVSKKGNYSEKRAATLIRTMLQVVAHCHTMGVAHRDLKPDNFLLTDNSDDAKLKCTDFGLSAFFAPGQPLTDVVGTPFYVAPEVLNGCYGPQADIWSCGVILYILLTGRAPFFGDTNMAIFESIQTAPAGANLKWPSGPGSWEISPAAKDAVHQMLERDVSKRAKVEEILRHDWLRENGVASDRPLDHALVTRIRGFAAMNRLKKQALKIIAGFLPEQEIRGLRKLFQQIDADGTGMITVSELQEGLKTKGTIIPVEELEAILLATDVDGNGKLDYREFLAATIHLSKMEREDLLYRAFHELDQDKSGFITRQELAHVLGDLGVGELDKVMKEVDENGDGKIDYREFVTLMRGQRSGVRSPTRAPSHKNLKSVGAKHGRLENIDDDNSGESDSDTTHAVEEGLMAALKKGASFALKMHESGDVEELLREEGTGGKVSAALSAVAPRCLAQKSSNQLSPSHVI